jgi:hypothetical protein
VASGYASFVRACRGAEEQASGTIEVEEWGCERGDEVRLSVDATLGSEFFEAPTVRVDGTVETEIGEPPPGWG